MGTIVSRDVQLRAGKIKYNLIHLIYGIHEFGLLLQTNGYRLGYVPLKSCKKQGSIICK